MKSIKNITSKFSVFLLSMTLVTTYWLSGMYARYTTTHDVDDATRVIGFGDITINKRGIFNEERTIFAPGANIYGNVNIDFEGSDTSVYIFVELTLSSNWDVLDTHDIVISSGDVLLLDAEIGSSWNYLNKFDNSVVYYQHLDSNINFNDNVFESNSIVVSPFVTDEHLNLLKNITIKFDSYAVQSNGFGSVESAWERIKGGEL